VTLSAPAHTMCFSPERDLIASALDVNKGLVALLFDNDDSLGVIAAHLLACAAAVFAFAAQKRRRHRRHGGSVIGKRANRDIGRVEAGIRIDKDYFCQATTAQETARFPTFTEVEFERRLRIPRAVYEELRESVL
jgi:hypothetical protein